MPDPVLTLDGSGPLYEQIRRAIAQKITRRDWRPGDRVPFENELSGALSVSRMTVNKAMQALADDGLIVRRRKAGSFVAAQEHVQAPLTIARIEDEVAASGRAYGYELLSSKRADAQKELSNGSAKALHILCRHLADDEPIALEERFINLQTVPQAADATFESTPPGSWLLTHVPWTEAEHAISAVAATQDVSKFLGIDPGAPCLQVERRTWAEGRTVTFVRLIYPGDRRTLVGRFQPGQRTT